MEAARALGVIGGSNYGGTTAAGAPRTLAHRLEAAANILDSQLDRLHNALCRVEGSNTATPQRLSGETPHIQPTAPLAATVERVEMLAQRLADHAIRMEQVA